MMKGMARIRRIFESVRSCRATEGVDADAHRMDA